MATNPFVSTSSWPTPADVRVAPVQDERSLIFVVNFVIPDDRGYVLVQNIGVTVRRDVLSGTLDEQTWFRGVRCTLEGVPIPNRVFAEVWPPAEVVATWINYAYRTWF